MEFRVEQYCYRVRWSAEDEEFVGTVAEFPSLSWLDRDQSRALQGIVELVREVVDDLEKSRESIPEPFSLRTYSGNIRLRMPPDQHRDLSILAAEEGVSLNRLICSLVGRGLYDTGAHLSESGHSHSNQSLLPSPKLHESSWSVQAWEIGKALTVVEGGSGGAHHPESHQWGKEM